MSDLPPLPQAPAGLEGRGTSEPEIIRWVARNIDVLVPDPSSCPDPFAWTLLRQCRADDKVTFWFTEKLWAKLIPSRSQLETTGEAALDGQATVDLLRRVEKIAMEAKGEERPVTVVPNAFEGFDPEEET